MSLSAPPLDTPRDPTAFTIRLVVCEVHALRARGGGVCQRNELTPVFIPLSPPRVSPATTHQKSHQGTSFYRLPLSTREAGSLSSLFSRRGKSLARTTG
jgi:hypothetical protein